MPVDNPLLRDSDLPPFTEIRPEHILPAVQQCLEAFRSTVAAISDPGSVHDFEQVLLATERQEERLGRVWAPVSHLHAVADSPALREAYAVAL
ncbi:MAG TPA: oligopeptidase A, partial [Mizugakiibacter sp.]|nr:oligopeptidase A [Mizugakiibacter sp.]